jgi:hypothetical protein
MTIYQPKSRALTALTCALALGAWPLAARALAPQSPIVAGPYPSVLKAIEAARTCGVFEFRLAFPPAAKPDEAALFTEASATNAQYRCINAWSTVHGKELKLEPRWWRDDFKSDVPPGVRAPWPPDK